MSAITTHILDVSAGVPARGVAVTLERETEAGWEIIGKGVTNDDGRVRRFARCERSLAGGQLSARFSTPALILPDGKLADFTRRFRSPLRCATRLSIITFRCCSVLSAIRLIAGAKFMPVKIIHNNYGKSRVRLMKVARRGELHELQNLTVKIAFEGEFTDVHTTGDNSGVLPTDTMKNTVYALAYETREIEEIESFGRRLADYFLTNNAPVSRVVIEIAEHGWTRINVNEEPHLHSFIKGRQRKAHDDRQRDARSDDD